MIGALRRLFDGAASEIAVTDAITAAHAQLAEAFGERRRRREALEEAEAALRRAESAIAEADAADQQLEYAEANAAAESARWAERGARADDATDHEVFARAAAARDLAHRLRLRAQGIETALGKLQRDIDEARRALEPCESRISEAAVQVIAAEEQAELDALVSEFWTTWFRRYARACGLKNLTARSGPGGAWFERRHPEPRMAGAAAHRDIAAKLAQLPVKEAHPDDSLSATPEFVERFRRLRDRKDV